MIQYHFLKHDFILLPRSNYANWEIRTYPSGLWALKKGPEIHVLTSFHRTRIVQGEETGTGHWELLILTHVTLGKSPL